MTFTIGFTADALRDLDESAAYLDRRSGPARARRILAGIRKVVESLSALPTGGSHPDELLEFGVRRYREVFFTRYRIIYRADERTVTVLLVADGRRDMRALLLRRLLAATPRSSGRTAPNA